MYTILNERNEAVYQDFNCTDENDKKAGGNYEMSAINPLADKTDLDTVSEAGTIKDFDNGDEEGNHPGNDNTEINEDNKESSVDDRECPRQQEESSM